MASEPVRDRALPARGRHDLDARRRAGARRARRGARATTVVVRGTGLREAREPDGPIDVGNAGTLLRLLPGWLAAQEGRSFTLDGDESIRRRPVDRIAEPLRADGRRARGARDGRFPPLTVRGARLRAISYELAGRQRPGEVVRAARRRSPPTARRRRRARRAAATTPSGCCCAPASPIHRNGRHVTVVNADELAARTRCACPATRARPRSSIAAGVLVPRLAPADRRRRRQLDAHRLPADRAAHAAGSCSATSRTRPASCSPRGAGQRPRRRPRRARGHGRRGRRGAAGDRRAAARGAARLLRRGRDASCAARRSCA